MSGGVVPVPPAETEGVRGVFIYGQVGKARGRQVGSGRGHINI